MRNAIFFFKIVLAILDPLHFHVNFRINLSISVKKATGILLGIAVNLQVTLSTTAILKILSFPIHEHGMSFLFFFFKAFFNFFQQSFIVFSA